MEMMFFNRLLRIKTNAAIVSNRSVPSRYIIIWPQQVSILDSIFEPHFSQNNKSRLFLEINTLISSILSTIDVTLDKILRTNSSNVKEFEFKFLSKGFTWIFNNFLVSAKQVAFRWFLGLSKHLHGGRTGILLATIDMYCLLPRLPRVGTRRFTSLISLHTHFDKGDEAYRMPLSCFPNFQQLRSQRNLFFEQFISRI